MEICTIVDAVLNYMIFENSTKAILSTNGPNWVSACCSRVVLVYKESLGYLYGTDQLPVVAPVFG
jgi:hypothetical protein